MIGGTYLYEWSIYNTGRSIIWMIWGYPYFGTPWDIFPQLIEGNICRNLQEISG